MCILTYVGIGFVALILLIVIISFFLPRLIHVERSVTINSNASAIFPHINSLKNFVVWSPWSEKDPNMKQTFNEIESGAGCKYTWSGDKKVGVGIMEISESIENKLVKTELDFGKRGTAIAQFSLEESNGKTTVKWSMDTDMGNNPMGRIMGLFMDKWVGTDHEHGLNKLKSQIENS